MLKGTITFRSTIKGNGLTFPSVAFNPNVPDVEKIELESEDGTEVTSIVHVSGVVSEKEGLALAEKVNAAVLERLSFSHDIVIQNSRRSASEFARLNPQPGVLEAAVGEFVMIGFAANLVVGIPADHIRAELEQAPPAGHRYYGLFRSARLSTSPVEEFMHLYNLLLMFFKDRQADVDDFIRLQDPTVPQTQHPMKRAGVMETVYSRLRNEFAHTRPGVNLEDTKAEMANRLSGLVALTKRAIQVQP